MFQKLKQIKEMRNKAKRVQGVLKDEFVEGSGGWGKIKVKMNGNQAVQEVVFDPEWLKNEDAKKIGDATKDAINDAVHKVQKIMVEKMRQMGELKF